MALWPAGYTYTVDYRSEDGSMTGTAVYTINLDNPIYIGVITYFSIAFAFLILAVVIAAAGQGNGGYKAGGIVLAIFLWPAYLIYFIILQVQKKYGFFKIKK